MTASLCGGRVTLHIIQLCFIVHGLGVAMHSPCTSLVLAMALSAPRCVAAEPEGLTWRWLQIRQSGSRPILQESFPIYDVVVWHGSPTALHVGCGVSLAGVHWIA